MSPSDNSALLRFLRTARWPRLTQSRPTFFSIAGIGHKELPLSNTYSFFFQSQAPHGLGKLFLRALLDVVGQRDGAIALPNLDGPVRVAREYPMDKGQWLDLLVHDGETNTSVKDATYSVLIENKVNHWLANDLDNYWQSVRGPSCKVGVVLSARRERPAGPWVCVTHRELALAVESRLGAVIGQADARYSPLLLQLLEHLKQMSDSDHDNFARAFDFAQQHRAALAEAQKLIQAITPQGLAAAIVEGMGPDYELRKAFGERADIQRTGHSNLRYIVFFGHLLALDKQPSFTIALYTGHYTAAWRRYLTERAAVRGLDHKRLSWFMYDGLLIGRQYPCSVRSVHDLREEVAKVMKNDWLPLEEDWLALDAPPA